MLRTTQTSNNVLVKASILAAVLFVSLTLGGCGGGGGGDTGSSPNTGSNPSQNSPVDSTPAAVTVISGRA